MAHKCHQCGSTDTSTGLGSFSCLNCGAVTKYAPGEDRGRIENPDGPATYATDPSDAKPEAKTKR